MSDAREFSRVDIGFVQIDRRPDGLQDIVVLRSPNGDKTNRNDVVCIHMRCRQVDVDTHVLLVNADEVTKRSVAPVEIYQRYGTKTVVIRPGGRLPA